MNPKKRPHAKPFSPERTKVVVCKIIFFYSIFYMVMKVIAIVFEGAWVKANLLLSIPCLFLAIGGAYLERTKKYTWLYVIVGVLTISLIRFYEKDLMIWLQTSL